MRIYGYCKATSPKMGTDTQVKSILAAFPGAEIVSEYNTGTEKNKRLYELLETIEEGDTIIFESVSRMCSTAQEGADIYLELYHAGVELIFLKQRQIDTAVYRKAVNRQAEIIGAGSSVLAKGKLELLKEFTAALARDQIEISFMQAEKDSADLIQRDKDGLRAAKLSGRRIGLPKGSTVTTSKELDAIPMIRKINKRFGGSLNDLETAKALGISRQTVAKYIAQMQKQDQNHDDQ